MITVIETVIARLVRAPLRAIDFPIVADLPLHAGQSLKQTFIHLPKKRQTVPRKTTLKKRTCMARLLCPRFSRLCHSHIFNFLVSLIPANFHLLVCMPDFYNFVQGVPSSLHSVPVCLLGCLPEK